MEYTERIFEFPNMIARVYIPIRTPEEEKKRQEAIGRAAANLILNREAKRNERNTKSN